MNETEFLATLGDNQDALSFAQQMIQTRNEAIAEQGKSDEKIDAYEAELSKIREVKESLEGSLKTLKSNIRSSFNLSDDAPTGEADIKKYVSGLSEVDITSLKDKFAKEKEQIIEEMNTKMKDKYKTDIDTLKNEVLTYKTTIAEKEKSEKFNEFFNSLLSHGFKKDDASMENLRTIAKITFDSSIENVNGDWGVFSKVGDTKVKEKSIDDFLKEFADSKQVQVNKETTTKVGASSYSQPTNTNVDEMEYTEEALMNKYKDLLD